MRVTKPDLGMVQETGVRIQKTEYRIQNTEVKIQPVFAA